MPHGVELMHHGLVGSRLSPLAPRPGPQGELQKHRRHQFTLQPMQKVSTALAGVYLLQLNEEKFE